MTALELDDLLTRGGTYAAVYGLRTIPNGSKIAALFAGACCALAQSAHLDARKSKRIASIEYAVWEAFDAADHQRVAAQGAYDDGSPDAASDCARRAWAAMLDACAYVGADGDTTARAILHELLGAP